MTTHLYVYYTVPLAETDALRRDVAAMLRDLRTTHGVDGRLMKRPDAKDGRETWMEVYEGVDASFDAALARAVATIDWRTAGPRRVERFVDVER